MASFSKKTQIYVSEEQWQELLRESGLRHTSVAELIRQAIDEYLMTRVGDAAGFGKILQDSSGIWRKRPDIKSGVDYVEELRHGWRIRETR